ncbi:ATP-binding protein [Neobacillus ginsengisoli]|uniref:ATP-binding protein n=1 Tax=Neobacillus ginsengisoli TaxID=904295 RepID=A0ABT9XWJ2_9BACI|nr:ATP-binding protein [Neobacillus ginsengisoli]MDQ0199635.1 hypothetical protein [Neobacillus ginsengisoli]
MRDVLTIPFDKDNSLIIASDNSGAIGLKDHDLVAVPYDTVAYYSFRVAVMECIAAGGQPMSVILQNFCGNGPWEELVRGIQTGLDELGLKDVSITGSTESNFSLLQSAVGVIVLGKKPLNKITEIKFSEQLKYAVIGLPLVGMGVIENKNNIVPLSIFQEITKIKDIMIWPVGSKGILFEMNQMFQNVRFSPEFVTTNVDLLKSSGPATCIIVAYPPDQDGVVKKFAGRFFHSVQIER